MSRRTAEADKAIRLAWVKEQGLVKNGKGTRDWTEEQQRDIFDPTKGRAYDETGKAFEGHHMKSVEEYPDFQGNPDNIQFLTKEEHLYGTHKGNWQIPTNWFFDPMTKEYIEFEVDDLIPCAIIELSNPIITLGRVVNRSDEDESKQPNDGFEKELKEIEEELIKVKKDASILINSIHERERKTANNNHWWTEPLNVIKGIGNEAKELLYDKLDVDMSIGKSRKYDITEEYISLISPYISDMRELASICNEFIVYKESLKESRGLALTDEKLFSLVAFKNMYPHDFADLEEGNPAGVVRRIFGEKERWVKEEIDILKKERQDCVNKLELCEKETLNSIKELKMALIYSLGNPVKVIYRVNNIDVAEILSDGFDLERIKTNPVMMSCVSSGRIQESNPIPNILQYVKRNGNYFERIERMGSNFEETKENLRKQIAICESKGISIHSYSLKEILEETPDYLAEYQEEYAFLVFLLRKGYIDENYENYINYFYPNSITIDDQNFIIRIRDCKGPSDYTFHISNVERVFRRLRAFEFKQKEVLNFELVDYLLKERPRSAHANAFWEQLSDRSDESKAFTVSYIERGMNLDTFLRYLSVHNEFFWLDITHNVSMSFERKCEIFNKLLHLMEVEDIISLDVSDNDEEHGAVSTFLTSRIDVLSKLSNDSIDKQIDLISELKIVFEDIALENLDRRVIDHVFDNCAFSINKPMIEKFYRWKAPDLVGELSKRNYTTIKKSQFTTIVDYIRDSFSQYIEDVVLEIDSNTEEDAEAVIEAINLLGEENEELCVRLVEKENVTVLDIEECCTEYKDEKTVKRIWDALLYNQRIVCSWDNLQSYFGRFGLNEELKNYIEQNRFLLSKDLRIERVTGDFVDALLLADFSFDCFKVMVQRMIKGAKTIPFSISISQLDKKRVKILILEGRLPFNFKVWDDLAKFPIEYRIMYAERNETDLIDSLGRVRLGVEERIALLESSLFSVAGKSRIAEGFPLQEIDEQKAKALSRCTFLLNRNVFDAAWAVLGEKDRIVLLINQMDLLKDSELNSLFRVLGGEYCVLADEKKRKIKLENNFVNSRLFAALERRGFLSVSKYTDNNGDRVLGGKALDILIGTKKKDKKRVMTIS